MQYRQDGSTNRRIITISEILPKEWAIWAQYQAPQHWVLYQEDEPPEHLALKTRESYFGRARGLWEIETPPLKSAHKISHALGPRAEAVIWKEPGSDLPADLGEPPREAGGNWSSPWGHRHWWQTFGGAHSTTRDPPSSSLALGLGPIHQPGGTSTGMPQAKRLAGGDAVLPTGRPAALRPPEPTAAPGPGSDNQTAQDLATATHLKPGLTHQWISISPRIPWGPAASCLMTWPHALAASSLWAKQGWQPTGPGPAIPIRPPTAVSTPQQKDPLSPHRGHP